MSTTSPSPQKPVISPNNLRLLIIILVAIIIVSLLALLPNTPPQLPQDNADTSEIILLRDWLEGIGFQTRDLATTPLDIGNARVVFVLGSKTGITTNDSRTLRTWVRQGNTLIVAGLPAVVNPVMSAFGGITVSSAVIGSETVVQAGPTLKLPPVDIATIRASYRITSTRTDLVVHYYVQNSPAVISFPEGNGTVWVLSTYYPFTNAGLSQSRSNSSERKDRPNAELVLNMLAGVPSGAMLAFDETVGTLVTTSGSGSQTERQESLLDSLLKSPAGWALILTVVLTITFLSLRGRRFGKAVPLPDDRLRREPVEYIQAIANLLRRARQRAEVQKHYSAQIRRLLSERYSIDPKMGTTDLLRTVSARDPHLNVDLLRDILNRLAVRRLGEEAMVKLASDVDQFLRSIK